MEKSMVNKAKEIMKQNNLDYVFVSFLMYEQKYNPKNIQTIYNLIDKKIFQPNSLNLNEWLIIRIYFQKIWFAILYELSDYFGFNISQKSIKGDIIVIKNYIEREKKGWLQNPVMTKGFYPKMQQDRDKESLSKSK